MQAKAQAKHSCRTRSVTNAFTRRFLWTILRSSSPEMCANINNKHLSENKSALHYKANHVIYKKHNDL